MATLRPDNPRSESNSSQNHLLSNQTGNNTGDRNGWKPWTLKPPALLGLFITTLFLAAVVEFLAQTSQRQGGGLALSESPGNIPPLVNLAYLYLPTIVAVLYGLAWSWVASDAKRMQPWLEMSKPEGALAEDSLLLDYPSTFFAWVPIRAASKRHWPVFLSGIIVLIVTCTITPLQGTILKIERINVGVDSPFLVTSRLPPVSRQSPRMDVTLLNTAYATTFLDQPMPPFTTPDYTLLPARFQGGPDLVNKYTNFTVATTRLTTDLDCRPAIATWEGLGNTYTFDNNRGCKVKNIPIDEKSVYTMHYIGWQTNSWSEYGLNSSGLCSEGNRHQVLVVWARRYSPSSYLFSNGTGAFPGQVDITASFCEPRYWKQRVLVSLSSNQSVLHAEHGDSIQPLGAAERIDNEFNKTAFESFLSGGQPPDMPDGGEGSTFIYRVSSDRHFMGIGLQRTLANMIGFALGGKVTDLSVYKDSELLTKTFEAMHRVMFSLTMARINSLEASPDTDDVIGIVKVPRYGITVSRRFAIAVESLLLAVALLNIGLLLSCQRAKNKLSFDPDSIKGVATLAKQSNALRTVLSAIDAESGDGIRHALHRRRFYLRGGEDGREVQIDIFDPLNVLEVNDSHSCSRLYTPDIPATMKPLSGFAILLLLVATLTYLSYLKVFEQRSQGLPLPMNNRLALEIIENYVPVVFATLVGSFLVLLNRLLAIIQPFNELQQGHSSSSKSIDLKYTSLPPQLLLWKAVKAKHLLLGFVCLVTILGNALSVSLGALFNELPVVEDEAIDVPVLQTPTITKNSLENLMRQVHASPNGYNDHTTIAEVYWTTHTKLPPWLTEEYFFLPFDLDHMLDVSAQSCTARTHGVTVAPSCKLLPPVALTRTSIDPPQFSRQPLRVESGVLDTLPWMECINAVDLANNIMNSTGNISKELIYPGDRCSRRYIHAWARSKIIGNDTVIRNAEVIGLTCQPKFVTAEFDLTVDNTGRVLQANRVSDFGPLGLGPGNGSHILSLKDVAFNSIQADSVFSPWRNDSRSETALSHFLDLRNNSLIYDTASLPDPSWLIPEVEAVTKMLTGALFQQNPTIFEKATNSTPTTQGTRRITVTNIFMADVAFIISTVLLSLNVVTVIVVYVFGPTPSLPRFPDTIGSVLGYVAKSRLTEPDWETAIRRNRGEEEGMGEEKPRKTTYSFGRYTDRNGFEHLGIDVDPYVVKVDSEGTPQWQGQNNKNSWLARLRGKSGKNPGVDDCNES